MLRSWGNSVDSSDDERLASHVRKCRCQQALAWRCVGKGSIHLPPNYDVCYSPSICPSFMHLSGSLENAGEEGAGEGEENNNSVGP